ncbi:MAG: hypothetical protein AAB682_00210 [Patescibacteria group bacterium]
MNPKRFLLVGGIIFLCLGILGYFTGGNDRVGPFGSIFWLTTGENIVHAVLGIVAIIASYFFLAIPRKWLTVIIGLIALYFGLIGFSLSGTNVPALNYRGVANLEFLDNLIHLGLASVAFWAASKKDKLR